MSNNYLNFQEISNSVNFVDVLNWLNIPYAKKKGEFRGETNDFKFIINIEKNLFFSPDDETIKGSVINFLSDVRGINLREAAMKLKKTFLDAPKPSNREIPELELLYCKELEKFKITEDTAEQYEIGLVKQKSIMKGRISFKVYDENGNVKGYVGWHPEKKDWFFPKNFKRPLYNANNILGPEIVVTVNLFDCLRLISMGIEASSSLIAKSMTDKQEQILKKYPRIFLFHSEPENIVTRLSRSSYVKAPEIIKPLIEYSDEEIVELLG